MEVTGKLKYPPTLSLKEKTLFLLHMMQRGLQIRS
jgi:hypothetical protein